MTNTRIRARLLAAVLALVACLALAPVTARAAQVGSWSATSLAAFGMGFDAAAPGGGQQGPGGEGMPGAPGEEAAPAEEEVAEPEDALEAFTNTFQSYVDYAEIHPVRVYGSMAALVLGLIFAFAYRTRA